MYAYFTVDTTGDEMLFESATSSRTTRFFIRDKSGIGDTDAPVEIAGFPAVEWREERFTASENGIFVSIDEIPPALIHAVVAIEDHRFYEHHGVDILRTAKAAANTVFRFGSRFGGSTVTQQLIKNISGDRENTPLRKLREIVRAVHLEKKHTKEEIMEAYLNVIPLSKGCVGVKSAAELYFGKPVSELSVAECASLIAITNAPARYDPLNHPDANRRRRDVILGEMLRFGYIDEETHRAAIGTPVETKEGVRLKHGGLSWYTETVLEDIVSDLMKEKGFSESAARAVVYGGGLTIYTLMDRDVQATLEKYFENERHFADIAGQDYAMTVIDPRSGDLLGVIGNAGKKTEDRLLNYASGVLLPPGSALKPLSVYAPAIERGKITWSSIYDDTPVECKREGKSYSFWPRNAGGTYGGLTTVADAIAYSKNTVAVKVLREIGIDTAAEFLEERFGLALLRKGSDKEGKGLTDMAEAPLALGQMTNGVTLRDLTAAYTAFTNGGNRQKCRSYLVVLDPSGNLLLDNRSEEISAVNEETAALMTELLRNVVSYGTASSLTLDEFVECAGKTGTAGKGEKRFFVGYTPYFLAGVYVGSHDGKSAVHSGSEHLRIFDSVMTALHAPARVREKRLREFSLSESLVKVEYCKDSGCLVSEACGSDPRGCRTETGYFLKGTEPHAHCDTHVLVLYDKTHGGVARKECLLAEDGAVIEPLALLKIPKRNLPYGVKVKDEEYRYIEGGEREKSGALIGGYHALCPYHDGKKHGLPLIPPHLWENSTTESE